MEFESANPSMVRSIKQRVLLNAWLRSLRKLELLPALADFNPEGIMDELADMMGSMSSDTATARVFSSPMKARRRSSDDVIELS